MGNPPLGGTWDSQGRKVQIRWLTASPNNLPYQRIRSAYYAIVQVNNDPAFTNFPAMTNPSGVKVAAPQMLRKPAGWWAWPQG